MWLVRLMPALVLEVMVGALLLGFGKLYVLQGAIQEEAAALILVAMNTFLLCLWAEMDSLTMRSRALLIGGTLVGGAVACLGTALAQEAPLWDVLTVAGILGNMEVAAAVIALTRRVPSSEPAPAEERHPVRSPIDAPSA